MSCKCCKECCGDHKFEPRYSTFEGQPDIGIKEAGRWNDTDAARHFLDGVKERKDVIYVCDVCVKCGKIINKV